LVKTTKCLVLSAKRLVAVAKFLVAATKIVSIVPNFVAVTKLLFFRVSAYEDLIALQRLLNCLRENLRSEYFIQKSYFCDGYRALYANIRRYFILPHKENGPFLL